MKKKKIIIGIHGLNNKPPEKLLKQWWIDSIREGLELSGRPVDFFRFELAYWARYFYDSPQDPAVEDENDPRYLKWPYMPSPDKKRWRPDMSKIKKKIMDRIEDGLDNLFFREDGFIRLEAVADYIIRNLFSDLDVYYHRHCAAERFRTIPAKETLRRELARIIRRHRRKDIMIIAHSMGTIIAYDVLSHEIPKIEIDTLVTIGSPLGLPAIRKKIFEERGMTFDSKTRAPAPESIARKWYNIADLNDRVAFNYSLADDFSPNSHGVGPEDSVIKNDYAYKGKKDYHSAFGYLRSPQAADVIYEFVRGEKPGVLERIAALLKKIVWR
jgi:hypothetical protein